MMQSTVFLLYVTNNRQRNLTTNEIRPSLSSWLPISITPRILFRRKTKSFPPPPLSCLCHPPYQGACAGRDISHRVPPPGSRILSQVLKKGHFESCHDDRGCIFSPKCFSNMALFKAPKVGRNRKYWKTSARAVYREIGIVKYREWGMTYSGALSVFPCINSHKSYKVQEILGATVPLSWHGSFDLAHATQIWHPCAWYRARGRLPSHDYGTYASSETLVLEKEAERKTCTSSMFACIHPSFFSCKVIISLIIVSHVLSSNNPQKSHYNRN